MSDEATLLPCPFCGGEAQVMKMDLDSIEEGWKVWGVWCVNDLHAKDHYNHGHYIDNYPTEAEAIEAWNRRTPEQAIAATLGDGKLTAEQVRDAIFNGSVYASYDGTQYYASGIDMQAIADGLNAVLGDDGYRQAAEYWKGMYEELLTERIGEERDYPEHDGRYECPDCGNVVYYDELYGGGWTIYVEDYQIPFNHCPNCGKAVER